MLAIIRAVFSLTSRITPKLTGRMAFRLFCTTFGVRTKSAQHKAILERAQQQFSHATQHSISYFGGTIAAFEFSPSITENNPNEGLTAVLVHGWQSHSAFMAKFIEPLQKEGFRVIAIDLPGHGQSSGRTFHLPLAVAAMHATREKLGEFDMIISHSLGGAVVATTLAGTLPKQPKVAVSKLVLISSPDSMTKIFDNFSNLVGLNKASNHALHDNVVRLSGRKTNDFSVATQLQQVDANVLILHAPDDKEVPYSEAESISQANNDATLVPMKGLGHRRIIADDTVVAAAVEFIAMT